MDGYLSNKPNSFVDDPEKLYRLRRREAQDKKLEFADPKVEAERSSESPKESPPQSPTSTDGRITTARVQDRGAMHPGHR
jgi:hypothetical protein